MKIIYEKGIKMVLKAIQSANFVENDTTTRLDYSCTCQGIIFRAIYATAQGFSSNIILIISKISLLYSDTWYKSQ
jgi:hypothetical protein